MDTPDPGVSPAAPPQHERTPIEAILGAVKGLLPAVALSVALPLMVFVSMPESNEKVVLSLVSGLFGFLTGRASSPRSDAK